MFNKCECGRLDRSMGEELVLEFENKKPYSLELFMKLLGLTDQELEEIIQNQIIDPWDGKIPVEIGAKPHDYDAWVRRLISNT